LPDSTIDSVLVHAWNGTRRDVTRITLRLAELRLGQEWSDAAWARLLVKFDALTPAGSASVRVCRYSNSLDECSVEGTPWPAAKPNRSPPPRRRGFSSLSPFPRRVRR
jgi:hypothetical protein